jgi:hypothetical protein
MFPSTVSVVSLSAMILPFQIAFAMVYSVELQSFYPKQP